MGEHPHAPAGVEDSGEFRRLLHSSHIFASTVRDVLEQGRLRQATRLPLTLAQLRLLKVMSRNGGHKLGKIAAFLGVSPPAATRNVDKLERNGLVVRQPATTDRRSKLLSVTEEGRRIVEKCDRLERERLGSVLDRFEPEEVEQLSRFLERFSLALLEQEPLASDYCLRCAAHIEPGCPVGHLLGGCPHDEARGET